MLNREEALYYQCLGLCRGKEKRAKLLKTLLFKTDNPYLFLMWVLKRKTFRQQVLLILDAHKGIRIKRPLVYVRSLRIY